MPTYPLPFDAGQPPRRSSTLVVLWPLMLVLFISTLDQTIVASAIASIGSDLRDSANASWVATSYLLTSAISTLILGKLGDMYGRKRILQLAIALFVLGSALCAMAPTMLWLIGARALQGIGGGGLNSLVMAIVGEVVPPRERARHQALLGIVPALAIILGPLLGGVIVDHWRWAWIFVINVPIGVLALAVIGICLHLPVRAAAHRPDIAGALLVTLFATPCLLVMSMGGSTFNWASWQVLGLMTISLISLIAYVQVERVSAEPITPLILFSNRIFSLSSALFFLSAAALFVAMLYGPLMLQMVFRDSALVSGSSLVTLLLGLIAATMVSGAVISQTGRYRVFPILGALLAGLGFYLLGRVRLSTPLWQIMLILAMLGVALGFFIQVVVVAGQNAVEPRHLGAATGTLNFFKTMGGAAGSCVFGVALTAAMPNVIDTESLLVAFHTVFREALVMMALAFVLALLLQDKPLTAEMVLVAKGQVDVPEY